MHCNKKNHTSVDQCNSIAQFSPVFTLKNKITCPLPASQNVALRTNEYSILLWVNARWQPSPMKLTHPPPPDG